YVLANLGSGPISLNILDIINNSHYDLPYDKRSLAHAQRKLRAELVRRYAEHERTHVDTVHTIAREVGMMFDEDENYPDIEIENTEEEAVDRPYVLAIGDIFTDAFIALNKDEAKVTKDEEGVEWLSVKFGQKMPY